MPRRLATARAEAGLATGRAIGIANDSWQSILRSETCSFSPGECESLSRTFCETRPPRAEHCDRWVGRVQWWIEPVQGAPVRGCRAFRLLMFGVWVRRLGEVPVV